MTNLVAWTQSEATKHHKYNREYNKKPESGLDLVAQVQLCNGALDSLPA